jgi:AcrR family transcriptional regulator
MAYEVTKRIKGHDYRYAVEAYRDPQTQRRKTRWQYLGAVKNGEVQVPVERSQRKAVTRDDIVAATANLLAFRDARHITVAVIASSAGISRSAFYRHFANQQEAMDAAFDRIVEDVRSQLPALDETPATISEAKVLLRDYCEAMHRSLEAQSAFERLLRQMPLANVRVQFRCPREKDSTLGVFLRRLDERGLASIPEPESLADTIKGMIFTQRAATSLMFAAHDLPVPSYEGLYDVIERCVFGAPVLLGGFLHRMQREQAAESGYLQHP